ncbi:MAG: hypothetical protein IJ060_02175 [Oscillospiraceae bacterium]|nr:hypothetical protein [Oscillospiraceae bacterium]
MNRRFRVLVLVLLTAVLLLSAAIANLAYSGSGNQGKKPNEETPESGSAVTLYVQNGLWGARSKSGRVLIEPTWYYLRAMSDSVLIARRNDGREDRFGLLRTNGEQLVPFLYNAFEQKETDLWVASLTENGVPKYHLYHSDGTRWINRSWDSVSLAGDALTVTEGESTYTGRLSAQAGRIIWDDWHAVFPVGLYKLTMNLDAQRLRALPAEDVLTHLGAASAEYLEYLFITREAPEDARISAENSSEIRAAHAYAGCQLKEADITRISVQQTETFPVYTVWMIVQYHELNSSGEAQTVRTGMTLRISRNAMGDYTYFGFTDARTAASGNAS